MESNQPKTEYSAEVHEIMGHVPHWILRWGLTLLFFILATLIAGSYFIPYPVTVAAPFTLTTLNSPAPLVVKKSGRIQNWLVEDGGAVKEGQLIAVLENDAELDNILILEKAINGHIEPDIDTFSLGSLTPLFAGYLDVKAQINEHNKAILLSKKRQQIAWEIDQKTAFYEKMLLHREVKRKEFELIQRRFHQDSTIYLLGNYGVSLYDYEKSLRQFYQEKAAFINYEASFIEHEMTIFKLKEKMEVLTNEHAEKSKLLGQELAMARQKLVESLDTWKSQNLIIAPRNGRLTLTKYWSSHQVLKSGEILATVVPHEQTEIIGRAMVSAEGIGKVKSGQQVNIKLSGFHPLEYGTLPGTVKSVSLVPEDQGYIVGIALSNGMTSTYQERLKFIQEMSGTVEIVTESKRLIHQIISP